MNKILLLVTLCLACETLAENKKSNLRSDLKTDVSFEELLVHGKYHFSDEAVTTVEDDKILDALLPVRKDFKDRIKRSAKRY